MGKKNKSIKIRVTETMFQKLCAICAVTGKKKTRIVEELIENEFSKDSRYWEEMYED